MLLKTLVKKVYEKQKFHIYYDKDTWKYIVLMIDNLWDINLKAVLKETLFNKKVAYIILPEKNSCGLRTLGKYDEPLNPIVETGAIHSGKIFITIEEYRDNYEVKLHFYECPKDKYNMIDLIKNISEDWSNSPNLVPKELKRAFRQHGYDMPEDYQEGQYSGSFNFETKNLELIEMDVNKSYYLNLEGYLKEFGNFSINDKCTAYY